jgi:hypothetical protein
MPSKRCQPGFICFENMTVLMIIVIVGVLYVYMQSNKNRNLNQQGRMQQGQGYGMMNSNSYGGNMLVRPNYGYSNMPNDVLLNPYEAPMRDDRFIQPPSLDIRQGIPINVSTQGADTTYRQVGILKRLNGAESVLPLMGKPLVTNRSQDKWNFYTMNEFNIKLPVSFKQKSCTSEYGCDNVYNGDTVYVEGVDSAFKVTVYDNAIMKYIPI